MSTEAALLRSITANRADDTARLVYADWLDENGEPDRAAYLRLQVELVREWWYDKPCTELYTRLADLVTRIDPTWLATARRCTTPALPVNVEDALPDLRNKAKTAVRLHPRPGEASVDASKIGGMFLWPKNEPWPVCPAHGDIPYVTALQLRKEDVPELGFLPGTDLFQLLWCPEPHDEDHPYCPKPVVYWRTRSDVKQELAVKPDPTDVVFGLDGFFPRPCVLHPERVVEYPDPFEEYPAGLVNGRLETQNPFLSQAVEMMRRLPVVPRLHKPGDVEELYQSWLSTAEGTKVGGHVDWVHNVSYPRCACGAEMEHLLSVASREYSGDSWGRWLPLEERPTLYTARETNWDICEPHQCTFGDAGYMYVFVCRNHREPQIRAKASG